MKWLVTGGAGFIGANFIYYLLEKYPRHEVICLDKLTYAGNLHTLQRAAYYLKFKFIKADITDQKAIFDIIRIERPDIIINFAAESHVDRSIETPQIFTKTNSLGTQTLMDACLEYGIRRFHQVSTDEVYGDLPLDRPDLFFTEDMPIRTSSPYSASKAAADLMVLAYHRTFQLPVTISRCSNNYGPFQYPEKLIPLVITKALTNDKVPVYGDGSNIRDWLFVQDHCKAIDLIVMKGKNGEVYNVGGNNERSNIYVVKAILKVLEKPESLITFIRDRPGHDLRYAIDASKLEKEIGWRPLYRFEEGIVKTIRWYLKNQQWLQKISQIKNG